MAAATDEKVEETAQLDAHNATNGDVSEEQYVVTDLPDLRDPDLIFEMYYLQCLAQGSYLIGSKSEGHCFIVDPRRDVDFYVSRIETLNKKNNINLKLKGILMTHAHADFVAGNVELANRINKDLGLSSTDKNACHSYFGEEVGTKVNHIAVNDQTEPLFVSNHCRIRPLHTPGHTLGCITWIVEMQDPNNNNAWTPCKAFTGDTLFIGSVGRPDLVSAPKDSPIKDADEMRKIMAGKMYDTLTKKIFDDKEGLPNHTYVHPAHGAGSPCGANLSDAMWSTIENERKTNIAWEKAKEGKDKFIEWLVGSSKDIAQGTPQYFEACVRANMGGVMDVKSSISTIHSSKLLSPKDFQTAITNAAKNIASKGPVFVVDTREADDYYKGHIANSLNFPIGPQKGTVLRKIDGNFAIWLGTLLPSKSQIFLVTYNGAIDDSIVRFTRINYDSAIQGMLAEGFEAWLKEGMPVTSIERFTLRNLSIEDAGKKLVDESKGGSIYLDVRTKHEYEESHVKYSGTDNNGADAFEAMNVTLGVDVFDDDKIAAAGLKKENKYIAYCSGGYRSTMASSILRYKGYNVRDIYGGYDLGLAPWIDQSKYLSGVHGLCAMSKKWAIKLGFEIPSLMAELQQK